VPWVTRDKKCYVIQSHLYISIATVLTMRSDSSVELTSAPTSHWMKKALRQCGGERYDQQETSGRCNSFRRKSLTTTTRSHLRMRSKPYIRSHWNLAYKHRKGSCLKLKWESALGPFKVSIPDLARRSTIEAIHGFALQTKKGGLGLSLVLNSVILFFVCRWSCTANSTLVRPT